LIQISKRRCINFIEELISIPVDQRLSTGSIPGRLNSSSGAYRACYRESRKEETYIFEPNRTAKTPLDIVEFDQAEE
jgi:hypothetical protein